MVKKKLKVIVGMSGGVDSSVAAALLKKQGYEVIGVFMKNWSDNFAVLDDCPWQQDLADAQSVAKKLSIPLEVFNFEQQYKRRVIDYFFEEYKAGRTPNPDILCNSEIKFKLFFDQAISLGADFIATGHYARTKKIKSTTQLLKGKDKNKDQSYFLYGINSKVLQKVLFPVGEYTKPEVRELALKMKLPTKDKPDSQGICFIGEVDLRLFLSQYIKAVPGDIIDAENNKIIGRHEGLVWYTIGQRRGIKVGGTGLPLYVVAKDMKKNVLYVVKGAHHPKLYQQELVAEKINWLVKKPKLPIKLQTKIRYRQSDQEAEIDYKNNKKDKLVVNFKQPQRAVTSGQSVVFYQGDVCLGGGIIK